MLLNPDLGLIIWTIVTFFVLMIVLRSVAWKPLLTMLDEREGRIQDALEQADQARKDAEAAAEENRAALASAQAEAQAAITQARETAERVAQEVREKAQTEAQQMLEQASRTIQQERDKALQELRHQATDLAILAAGRLLEENLDDERNRKIVDEFIDRIPGASQN